MPRYTREDAAKKLLQSNFVLVGDYNGCHNDVTVICPHCLSEFSASYKHLTTGHTQSCGCLGNRGELAGEVFGRWTVLRADQNKHGQKCWLCCCECGTERLVMTHSLTSGVSTSCGCYRAEHNSNKFSKGYKELSGSHWCSIQNSAKNRGIEFSLDIQVSYAIIQEQEFQCALSGVEISLARPKTASLDRIDSNGGYTPDNVQWVHKTVNRMKMNLDESEFVDWCRLITEKLSCTGYAKQNR